MNLSEDVRQERGIKGTTIGEEHIRTTGDIVEGVYSIDIDAAKAQYDLWEGVDQIIKAWVKLHPLEAKMHVLENKLEKASAYNKFAMAQSKAFRHSLSMPASLLFKLEAFEPTLFTNKRTLHEFMRRYEGFRTCQTV